MNLLTSQRRTLREIDKKIAAEDPELADLFTLFSLRAPGSQRPAEERLAVSWWRKVLARDRADRAGRIRRPLGPQLVCLLVMLLVATAACVAAAIGTVRGPSHPCRTQTSSHTSQQPGAGCSPPIPGLWPAGKLRIGPLAS
jgi:hypothetical protein